MPIIRRVKAEFKAKHSNKIIAQHVLNVFETINARPPGVGASIGLGAVHVASVVIVLLVGLFMVLGANPDLAFRALRNARAQQMATRPIDSNAIEIARGPAAPGTSLSTAPSSESRASDPALAPASRKSPTCRSSSQTLETPGRRVRRSRPGAVTSPPAKRSRASADGHNSMCGRGRAAPMAGGNGTADERRVRPQFKQSISLNLTMTAETASSATAITNDFKLVFFAAARARIAHAVVAP